jgi:hypothetical protein
MDVAIELIRPVGSVKKIDHRETLAWEKDLIGVYVSEHPLTRYGDILQAHVTATSADFDSALHGRGVTMLGLLTSLRPYITKKGNPMAFGVMEDLNGPFELIFFPKTWSKFRDELELDRVYMVRGEARIEAGDRAKVIVNSITNNLSVAQPLAEDRESDSFKSTPSVTPARNGRKSAPPSKPMEPNQSIENNQPGSAPPPPPNFEEQDADYLPPVSVPKQSRKSVDGPDPKKTRGVPAKTIVVEIRADPDWMKVCRQIVRMVSEYEGQDGLRIRIAGQSMFMEFPNQRTRLCSELITKIEQVQAVVRVEVVEITGNGPNSPS